MTNVINKQKHILIVDNDEALAKTLKEACETAGFTAKTISDGNVAQNAIGLEHFDLVISEIRIPSVNGIQLLHFIRSKYSLPVILMTTPGELTKESEALEMGAAGFLLKPLNKEELLSLINKILAVEPAPEEEKETDHDKNYMAVPVQEFVSGSELQFDIYVRLSAGKYVKVAGKGQRVEIPRISAYQTKGLRHLYLTKADFSSYVGFNLNLAKAVSTAPIAHEKKVRYMMQATSTILQSFYSEEISRETYEYGTKMVETAVLVTTQSDSLLAILEGLKNQYEAVFAQALACSMFCTLTAKQHGWKSTRTLTKVAIAGLIHDSGKKEISSEILKKPRIDLTSEEVKIIETHPLRGYEILSNIRGVPAEIAQVALQHHEDCIGTGYPHRLTKNRIIPVARLVKVVDEFCQFLLPSHTEPPISPKEALKKLLQTAQNRLDSDFVTALAGVFSEAKA